MVMSESGVQDLVDSEDLMPRVYLCQANVATIGCGHALSQSEINSGKIVLKGGEVLDIRNDRPLSIDEQFALLKSDLFSRELAVNELVTVELNQDQFNCLVHFVFNVGRGALAKSSLLKELNAGFYDRVPNELRKWKYVTQGGKKVISQGLINRREKECRMWSKGDARTADLLEITRKNFGPMKSDVFLDDDGKQINFIGNVAAGNVEAVSGEVKPQSIDDFLDQAKDLVRAEVTGKVIDVLEPKYSQTAMQSRTNKTLLAAGGALVFRILIDKTGAGWIADDPQAAEVATNLITWGLDVAIVGLGGLASHFRNIATKLVR